MIWLAPWAFVGLIGVGGPLLSHWLARRQAERLRFPSLQFLAPTAPVSVRRHRVRDVPLLLVRVAIVIAAVAAMAQPVWRRPAAPAAPPARAIVVDTSASLLRPRGDGRAGAGADQAREIGEALRAEAAAVGAPVLMEPAPDLPSALGRASSWLARQPAPREMVVVSDFQVGAIGSADLDVVPPDAALRLIPVAVSGPVPAEPAPARGVLRVRAGAADAGAVAAAEAAARTLAPKKTSGVFSDGKDTRRLFDVLLVFSGAPGAADLKASLQPVDTPGLFALVADIERERRLLEAAPEKTSGVFFAKKTPDVFSEDTGLAVLADVRPDTLEGAVLVAAVLRALEPDAVSLAEREPDRLASAVLERWQREATAPADVVATAGASDGRWLWLLALGLFAVEWRMRA